ncbi:hypothetical protein JXB41_04645 [Candidatus Woesearchaeota archaeon]|nr:hypothetical protein [Candidatus Woesearchaeota archaeon]
MNKQIFRRIFFVLAFLVFASSFSSLSLAQDRIIVNSADWRDVYSVMLYANLREIPANFLVSDRHSTILLNSIPESQEIEVISSSDNPFIVGYESTIKNRGYEDVTEYKYRNINLELARKLEDINKFIIVDDSYGYNALAVASYASLAGYYVLFADDRNIAVIDDFLDDRGVDDLILYGQLDREVKNALSKYNPDTIFNKDRFIDNVEIVKKYQERKKSKQVVMSNGEFIESSLMSGSDPVLFIGRASVPQAIVDYIEDSDFEIGVLVGNELIGTATSIRRETGLSVFVKFGQSARVPSGTISAVEDLDRFPMPRYVLDLSISSIMFNTATHSLEVTYKNNVDLATYLKGSITVKAGDESAVVGDEEPVFIDANEYKTFIYEIDMPIDFENVNLTADIYTIFGESPYSLENVLEGTFSVEIVTVIDDTLVEIEDTVYDARNNEFLVRVKNTGEIGAYVDVEIIDLYINGEEISAGSENIIKLRPEESAWVPVEADMAEEDYAFNEKIKVRARYGERENALIKVAYKEFDLKFRKADYALYVIIILIIILLLLIILTKKKCRVCGHKNPRHKHRCKKCGHKLSFI